MTDIKIIPGEIIIDLFRRVTVRQVVGKDLPALEWEGEFTHFRRLYAEAYASAKRGSAVLWVAELASSKIIGQLFVQLNSARTELADGRTRAYVYGFRIKPEYRGMGLGTHVMRIVEGDLRERGFRKVCLNVGRENTAALRLYERLGYRIMSTDPGRWTYIDHLGREQRVSEPAWRMEKTL